MRRLMRCTVIWTVVAVVAVGSNVALAAGDNIALGKPYTMAPAPNYWHKGCTEPDDAIQLTDGEVASGPGQLWVQKLMVGWQNTEWVTVVIDLGEVQAIDRVCMHSITGYGGVAFPSHINVAVSDDSRTWLVVGDMSSERAVGYTIPDADGWAYWFETPPGLAARGRYVRVAFKREGWFVFCDEIEVHGGDASIPAKEYGEQFAADDFDGLLKRRIKTQRLRDQHALTMGLLERCADCEEKLKLTKKLVEWHEELRRLKSLPEEQLAEAFRALQVLRSEVLGLTYGRKLVGQRLRPYEVFQSTTLPRKANERILLHTLMAQNEREPAAVLLANTTSAPLTVTVHKQGGSLPKERLQCLHTKFQDVHHGKPVADALPPLENGQFTIPPVQSALLYLLVDSRGLQAGRYESNLTVEVPGESLPVRLVVQVAPVKLPDEPDLYLYNWSYLDYSALLKMDEQALADDLDDHYINTFIFRRCPWPKLDEQGNLTEPINFTLHDHLLDLHSDAKFYMWFWWFGGRRETFGGAKLEHGSQAWENGIKNWVCAWVEHLKELGIDYDRFAFYPYDEAGSARVQESCDLADLIHQVDPNIKLFADPYNVNDVKDSHVKQFTAHFDIFCPLLGTEKNWPSMFEAQKQGTWLWNYSVMAKHTRPQAYRDRAWQSFLHGYEGCGFWSYGDITASAWDDFDGSGRTDYGVIYESDQGPVTSRRWEAWRDGVEDYMLMRIMEERGVQNVKADVAELVQHPSSISILRRKWLLSR